MYSIWPGYLIKKWGISKQPLYGAWTHGTSQRIISSKAGILILSLWVRLNRSRLDFFICSTPLLTSVTDCYLSPELATKLFDHKTVFLDLNTKNTKTQKSTPRLRNTFLKDPYLNASVGLSSITC